MTDAVTAAAAIVARHLEPVAVIDYGLDAREFSRQITSAAERSVAEHEEFERIFVSMPPGRIERLDVQLPTVTPPASANELARRIFRFWAKRRRSE